MIPMLCQGFYGMSVDLFCSGELTKVQILNFSEEVLTSLEELASVWVFIEIHFDSWHRARYFCLHIDVKF